MKPGEDWFVERIGDLPHSPEVKAYVVGVLVKFVTAPITLASDSVVLAYADARFSGDFVKFQDLGDSILWTCSIVPTPDTSSVLETIGRLSYETCHNLLKGQWEVYRDLSRNLMDLTKQVHARIALRV